MKKKTAYFIGTLILGFGIYWAYQTYLEYVEEREHQEWLANAEHTASKQVQIFTDTITINYLNEKRTLAVYLPENYNQDSMDYSVIYFLDGQSLFDQKIQEGTEWEIDEVLDSLNRSNQEQSIVIGIYSSEEDRLTEYKPFPSDRVYSDKVITGDQHAEWIVKELKPWVDQRYRTKKDAQSTVIAGASLGGLMSYYMLMEYPQIFGRGIVFSPSFWVHEKVYTLHEKNEQLFQQKIYFDAGAIEVPTVESIEKMRDILLSYGMPKENIKLDIEPDLGHWHLTWKNGFKKAYPWIVRD